MPQQLNPLQPLNPYLRTIRVATRVTERELHVTYINALTEPEPYVVTVILKGPPFSSSISTDQVPAVGQTKVFVA